VTFSCAESSCSPSDASFCWSSLVLRLPCWSA
jgi:hypothetical protein